MSKSILHTMPATLAHLTTRWDQSHLISHDAADYILMLR